MLEPKTSTSKTDKSIVSKAIPAPVVCPDEGAPASKGSAIWLTLNPASSSVSLNSFHPWFPPEVDVLLMSANCSVRSKSLSASRNPPLRSAPRINKTLADVWPKLAIGKLVARQENNANNPERKTSADNLMMDTFKISWGQANGWREAKSWRQAKEGAKYSSHRVCNKTN